MTTIETLQSTHLPESLRGRSANAAGDNNISRRLSSAGNCSSPAQQDYNAGVTDGSSIAGCLVNPFAPGVIEGRGSITEQPAQIAGTITRTSTAQTANTASIARQPTDISPSRPARIDATAITQDVKPGDPVKDAGIPSLSSRNKIINVLLRTTTLAVGVAMVIAPMALWAGLPLTSMLAVAGIALLISAALNYHVGHEPTKFAAMLKYILSLEPKNFAATLTAIPAKLTAEVKHWVGALLAGTVATGYNATWKGTFIAGYSSYKMGKRMTGPSQDIARLAGSIAVGAAVGTVEKLAGPLANQAMRHGAERGADIGVRVLNSIQGSDKVGEMAGYGAFTGAFWGKKLARRLLAISPAPEFLQKLANESESSMASAGGITYGVSAAIDIRTGENISTFGKAVGAAYNFVRSDYLNHIPQDFPNARIHPNNNADFRNLDID